MGRSILARLLGAHTVTVEAYEGTSGRGTGVFAQPVTVTGFLDDQRRTVVGTDGVEVVSESTFYTLLEQADRFPPDSRVTVPGDPAGVTRRVIRVNAMDTAGLARRVEHVAVTLT